MQNAQCRAAAKIQDRVFCCMKKDLHKGAHKAVTLSVVTPDPTKGVFDAKALTITWWY